jgi:hypothetical protein
MEAAGARAAAAAAAAQGTVRGREREGESVGGDRVEVEGWEVFEHVRGRAHRARSAQLHLREEDAFTILITSMKRGKRRAVEAGSFTSHSVESNSSGW